MITRALGTEPDVDVDAFTVEARDGDLFLLCSDGLTTMVDADTIADDPPAQPRASLDAATHALIKAANDRGGDDNITAILFAVADGDPDATAAAARPRRRRPTPTTRTRSTPRTTCRLPDAVTRRPPDESTMVVSAAELAQGARRERRARGAAALVPAEPAASERNRRARSR